MKLPTENRGLSILKVKTYVHCALCTKAGVIIWIAGKYGVCYNYHKI